MRQARWICVVALALSTACQAIQSNAATRRGVVLEDLTWDQAERVLTPDTIVVLPLGAAAKEHGSHLLLKNDLILADYLRERVLERCDVVVAPTITYSYYPKFAEYPGTISTSLDTARDLVVETCRSLARFGPKRFYVVNTGVSTRHALGPASEILSAEGIALHWTNLLMVLEPIEKNVAEQPWGSHADEIETSIMLFIAPETVDMTRAVRDCGAPSDGPLVRDPSAYGTYSPSGCYGDPTLATREKGRFVMNGWVEAVVREIEELRRAHAPFEAQHNS